MKLENYGVILHLAVNLCIVFTKGELLDKQFEKDFSVVTNAFVTRVFMKSFSSLSLRDCIKECFLLLSCKSMNYNNKTGECQLSSDDYLTAPDKFTSDLAEWTHLQSNPFRPFQGEFCQSIQPCQKFQYCIPINKAPYYKCIMNPCKNSGLYIFLPISGWQCLCPSYAKGISCEYIQAINFLEKHTNHTIYSFSNYRKVEALTICFWLYFESYNYAEVILGIFKEKCYQRQMLVRLTAEMKLSLYLEHTKEKMAVIESLEKIQPNVLNHVCLLWSYQKGMVYINGTEKTNQSGIPNTFQKFLIQRFIIGQDADKVKNECIINNVEEAFTGYIGLLNVWSAFLNQQEILDIYHGHFLKNDLIASWDWFWDFEEQQNIIQKKFLRVA